MSRTVAIGFIWPYPIAIVYADFDARSKLGGNSSHSVRVNLHHADQRGDVILQLLGKRLRQRGEPTRVLRERTPTAGRSADRLKADNLSDNRWVVTKSIDYKANR